MKSLKNVHFRYFSAILLVLFSIGVSFAAPAPGSPTDKETPKGWYEDAKRGFFWMEDPPPEEEKKKEEEELPPSVTAQPPSPMEKQPFVPDLRDYTIQQLWTMHPDQFNTLVEGFQKKAVQTLDPQDIKIFVFMQDLARRRSVAFTQAYDFTIQTSPELNINSALPVAAPGRWANTRAKSDEKSATLAQYRDGFALLFFSSSTCSFCQEQSGILRYFNERTGWQVKKIDIQEQPGVAARFNIQTTPTLLMIQRDSEAYIPVGVGVVTVDELTTNIYRGIRYLNGDSDPTNFNTYDYQRGGVLDAQSGLEGLMPIQQTPK